MARAVWMLMRMTRVLALDVRNRAIDIGQGVEVDGGAAATPAGAVAIDFIGGERAVLGAADLDLADTPRAGCRRR